MQAASALRSDLVCSAKARNMRPVGSLTSASDGASSASAIVVRQADAFDQVDAEPAEDRRERTRAGCLSARKAVMRAPIE